ncbi:hypothetical protein NE235_10420 [Actinoallomurus spadix]|uniref:Uncharacterized protein n=1 Tax=Actinoallomurus spadix TaxID=79912 RepID=A0ABP3GKE7_9ACTN|nr:hypothetical protein [Actinoallomurus spadix]MCO5986518.1 hypothetical protein [Actinoallomurus spadix]
MVAVTAAAPTGPRPDPAGPDPAGPDRPDVPEAGRPGFLRGLLDLITLLLAPEPDLHAGDDGHALDEEGEPDAL